MRNLGLRKIKYIMQGRTPVRGEAGLMYVKGLSQDQAYSRHSIMGQYSWYYVYREPFLRGCLGSIRILADWKFHNG